MWHCASATALHALPNRLQNRLQHVAANLHPRGANSRGCIALREILSLLLSKIVCPILILPQYLASCHFLCLFASTDQQGTQ